MSHKEQAEQIKSRILQKYDYLNKEPEKVDECYDIALSDYIGYKYPSENNRPTPQQIKMDFTTSLWLYKRMVDIFERVGLNLNSYKENGVSFTFGSSYIDTALVAEIMPKGRVPR